MAILLAALTVTLGGLPAVVRSPSAGASAVGAYDNASIADVALRYVGRWGAAACVDAGRSGATGGGPLGDGNNADGECRAFVNCVVWMASGHTQWLGGADYFQPFMNAGAQEITDINQLAKGDIVQIGQGTHTFIIVGRTSGSTFRVVDSNHAYDRKVMTYDRAGVTLGGTTRAFRLGAIGGGSIRNGQFVSYQGNVYIVAGGAPIYVSSWAHVGGDPGTRGLSDAEWNSLRAVPVDGTYIAGSTPGDTEHGSVYRIAGGAPLYVSSWAHVGGDPGTTVVVDLSAIKNAGGPGVWSHLRYRPADGTLISGYAPGDPDAGSVYRVAGGAPLYVSSWAHIGGDPGTTVGVDLAAIKNAGGPGVWSHLNYKPAEGTYISGGAPGDPDTGSVYRIAGGAPIYVSDWGHMGGDPGTTPVDLAAIKNAGQPGVWSHLNYYPADGTFIGELPAPGTIYRIAGGAPIAVSNWAGVGGVQPYVNVDRAAVDNLGRGSVWSHLRYRPADGTVLNAGSNTYKTVGGAPILQSTYAAGVRVDPAAVTHAGGSGVWAHLAAVPRVPSPPVISGVSAGDGAVVVSWSAPGDPSTSAMTGYEVAATPAGGSCSTGVSATSCRVTGLANGTSYTFRVRVRNAVGWSAWSAASTTVAPAPGPLAPAPAAPLPPVPVQPAPASSGSSPAGQGGSVATPPAGALAGLTVAFPARRTATLSWPAAANAISYRVRVSKRNSAKKWKAWTTVTDPSVQITGLKRKATYRVQILAVGAGGSGPTRGWKFKQRK